MQVEIEKHLKERDSSHSGSVFGISTKAHRNRSAPFGTKRGESVMKLARVSRISFRDLTLIEEMRKEIKGGY